MGFMGRKPQVRGCFDEPRSAVDTDLVAFRGWAASTRPITSVVLEADGRLVDLTAFHARPDVSIDGLPHVVGWHHTIYAGTGTGRPRAYRARLLVNGTLACERDFPRAPSPQDPGITPPDLSDNAPQAAFSARAATLPPSARVVEIGTMQAVPGVPTHAQAFFPSVERANYLMVDVRDGPDVDVVADLHSLPAEWSNRFDCLVAAAVFEHLERPWIAAREVARVLAPNGFCYIATHQTFPLHGHPSDFFRFSREALRLIFEDGGLRVLSCEYLHRAMIVPPPQVVPPEGVERWNGEWPSYITVHLLAEKAG